MPDKNKKEEFDITLVDDVIFGIICLASMIVAAVVTFIVCMAFFCAVYGAFTFFYYLIWPVEQQNIIQSPRLQSSILSD